MTAPDGPILLEPRYDSKIWGGRRLETVLQKSLPGRGRFGESLESAADSRLVSGPWRGKMLLELVTTYPHEVLGSLGYRASGTFHDLPLLAKFIDATDDLSVQVHPDDDAAETMDRRGKTEAWYVISADPDSRLITGLVPGVTVDDVRRAISETRLGDLLIERPVHAGDTLLIPAGTAHAIGKGVLLYEIQQASDVTYRMYDWGRVDEHGNPRDLHIDASLSVLKPELDARLITPLERYPGREVLAASRYFALERWRVPNLGATVDLPVGSFLLLSTVDGSVSLDGSGEALRLGTGQTALVPATLESLRVTGEGIVLASYVPDLMQDIILPLRRQGHADAAISALDGALDDIQALFDAR